LKIDVAIEDPDQKVLYLVQTKYSSPNRNPEIPESEVNDFITRHDLLMSGKWMLDHSSEELSEYIADYEERAKDGWLIHWYFVSTGTASERLQALVAERARLVQEEWPNVSFYLFDFFGLKEYFIETQTIDQQIPERVEFTLAQNTWIIKENPRRTSNVVRVSKSAGNSNCAPGGNLPSRRMRLMVSNSARFAS
jgi:hypothetical protein